MSKKQVLVVNADTAATTFAQIRGGQLGFIKEGAINASIDDATSDFQFAVGEQTTNPFKVSELIDAVLIDPAAGTAGTGTADFTNAVSGEPLYVKLINTTKGTMDVPMRSFEAPTLQGIVDAINAAGADSGSAYYGFSAALAGQVITVTAPINSTFRLAGTDGITIAYPVLPVPSVGTAEDIRELVENNLSSEGVTNKVGFPVIKPADKVVDGAQYYQYYYNIARSVPNKAGTGSASVENYQIVLAVKSDLAALIGVLDLDSAVED